MDSTREIPKVDKRREKMEKGKAVFRGLMGFLLLVGMLIVALPPAYASNDEAAILMGFYAEEIGDADTVLAVFNAELCAPPISAAVTQPLLFVFYNEDELRILERSKTLTECEVILFDPEVEGILSAPGFTGLGLVGVFASFGLGSDISGVQIIGFESPNQVGAAAPPNLLASNSSFGLTASNLQSDVTLFDGSFPFFVVTEDGSKTTLDSPWESFGVIANPASIPIFVHFDIVQRGERFLGDFEFTLTPRDIFVFTVDETLGATLVAPFLFGTTDIVAVDVLNFTTSTFGIPGASAGTLGWGFSVNTVSGEMMSYNMAQDVDDTVRLEDTAMTAGFSSLF